MHGRHACHELAVAWAAGPRAPVDVSGAPGESASIVWGRAHDDDGRAVAAAELERRLGGPPLGGFHVALHYDRRTGLRLGGDLLGTYPVYFWEHDGVLVVTTSTDALHEHPSFRAVLDEHGLAGLLLTTHLMDGRTLLRGVRRLGPAALLTFRPGEPARERVQWTPTPDRPPDDWPTERDIEAADRALAGAVERHTPPGPVGLMLTGGRDSRLLAGYLLRAGREVHAMTWGERRDDDVALARRVARAAGFPHTIRAERLDELPEHAFRTARFEQGGLVTGSSWASSAWTAELPPTVINGYASGTAVGDFMGGAQPDPSFEAFFARVTAWGIDPPRLRALLPDERFKGVVDDVLERAREIHTGLADNALDRAWCFDLLHRQRFHVCAMSWRTAFHAWPAAPVIDRQALDTLGRLTHITLRDRRIQDTLLRTRFPHLAAIPVDRNDNDPRPLLWPLKAKLEARARRVARRKLGIDRRRYYRIYDFNSAPWRAVRQRVEPLRPLGEELFDPTALARELPPPDAHFDAPDAIIDSAGAKTLLGVLLWHDRARPA